MSLNHLSFVKFQISFVVITTVPSQFVVQMPVTFCHSGIWFADSWKYLLPEDVHYWQSYYFQNYDVFAERAHSPSIQLNSALDKTPESS